MCSHCTKCNGLAKPSSVCHSERSVAESNFRGSKPRLSERKREAKPKRNLLTVFDNPTKHKEYFFMRGRFVL